MVMEQASACPQLVEQLALFGQRWQQRRASYRPAGEPFDPSRYAVDLIEEREAKAFVLRHHYSGSYPAARFRAGVFNKEPFGRARLVGVGVFSVPMNQRTVPSYFPDLQPVAGVELGRFVLDDSVPGNGESWAIARMRRLRRDALPEVRAEIVYCDPIERRDESGALVKRGHVGTIYKATNAKYRGRSSPRTLWLAPSGASFADRTLSKIRREEVGERYALARLKEQGAPARRVGEAGAAFIRRLQDEGWLRPLKHPGNHVFSWVD